MRNLKLPNRKIRFYLVKPLSALKISVLLLFAIVVQLRAENLFSQDAGINLSLQGLTVEQVLDQIESKTDLTFLFTDLSVDVKRVVDVELNAKSVAEALTALFRGTNVQFQILDKQVILSSKNTGVEQTKQSIKVTGFVKDSNDEPIIGANVLEKGTSNGTMTDVDGFFSINVSSGSTMIISSLGYIVQEIIMDGRTSFTVTLSEDLQALGEVVVVGFGTQKKENLTGAVSAVSIDELGKRHVGQTSLALQGLSPGLVITQRSGQPGADGGIISIRGKTTLNNNDALILVDGIEMGINNIDPSMIESISILKDAASSAIYGSRAANGVILITTKRAKSDQFKVSYSGYVGWQTPTDLPDVVDAIDHMNMTNLAYTNIGKSPLYSTEYIEEFMAGMKSNPDKYPNTDWVGQTLRDNGLMQRHFLTISGGSKRIRTVANFGYYEQNGVISNSKFRRYTFRINSDMDISSVLTAKIDGQVTLGKRKEPSRGDAFHWMNRIPSNQAGVLSTGQWGEGWNGDNPIAFTRDGGLREIDSPSATFNFNLIYNPTDWLTVQGSYAPNYWESHDKSFSKVVQTYTYEGKPYYRAPQKSTLSDATSRYLRNLVTVTATFDKQFGDHGVKILAGYQQEDHRGDGHSGRRENFAFPDYPVLSAGGEDNQKAYGWSEEWALQSLFGRVNYDYKGRYLFEANVRYDGSSRFAKGNKWGVFPSFSAGWRVSEEKFWEPVRNVVDNFKIRGSWGQLGNQNIGSLYPFSSDVNLDMRYVFNGDAYSAGAISNMANRNITWETTTVSNIGIDATLFNKLNVTGEYFYKKTKDILLKLNIPLIIGMNAPFQNAGVVENKGWEVSLNYTDKIGDFNYRVAFNISDVKNKVLDLKGIDETGLTVNREGEEMYSLYGLEAIGYIQPEDYDIDGNYLGAKQYGNFGPGDIKYKDQNGDGEINTSDRVIIGTTIPRYTFGLNLSGEYKGIDLSLLLQGIGKASGYINGQGIQPFYEGGTVQEQHKDYWTETNRNAKFPRLAFNETNNIQNSSFWKKNAAYVRLKNIQVGYSLPSKFLSKANISNLRLYFSSDNLLTFDKFWKGFDVEAPVGNGGYYPQLKTFSFGVEISF